MASSVIRLPLTFDAARMQADLERMERSDWSAHFNQRIYEGDWSVLSLRAVPGSPIPNFSLPNQSGLEDTPLLRRCDYLQQVLATFQCPMVSVRLLRLGPGASIQEHSDPLLSLAHDEVRIHVVVQTNPAVECRIDGIPGHWAEGECWYADFTKLHSFANRGDTERVHLVLDCRLNGWLRDLLQPQRAEVRSE